MKHLHPLSYWPFSEPFTHEAFAATQRSANRFSGFTTSAMQVSVGVATTLHLFKN